MRESDEGREREIGPMEKTTGGENEGERVNGTKP
jgi:hypothetical protein